MAKLFKNLFLLITLSLLIIILIRTMLGINEPFNLESFLQILSSAPSVNFGTINLTISADWGILNFFKEILNGILYIIEFLLSIVESFINFVSFLGYFLYSLFDIKLFASII